MTEGTRHEVQVLSLNAEQGGMEDLWEEAAKQSLGAENVSRSQSGTGGIGVLTETQGLFEYNFPVGLSRCLDPYCQSPRTNH